MNKKIILTIDEDSAGIRLDKALALHDEIRTRSRASKLIDLGLVQQNNQPSKASRITELGEIFEVEIPITSNELEPLEAPLDIFYEDDDVLVVNKPAGLVVHPAEGHAQDTLVNVLLHHVKNLSMGFGENRPGIVHRLDRDTSGLLVIAKNDFSHESLSRQFQERSVHRIYWCLVLQTPKPKSGTIISNLGRHPTDRKRFASIKEGGKHAITHYKTIEEFAAGPALLHVKLETGRTHQIRVHLSEKDCAILGDRVYSPNQERRIKSKALKDSVHRMTRIALHASELGFFHPKTKERLMFKAEWPTDLMELLATLKKGAP